MVSRRDALKSAIRQRRCPPGSIRQAAQWKKQYAAHCRICPFCEPDPDHDPKDDLEAWEMLARRFSKAFPDGPFPDQAKDCGTVAQPGRGCEAGPGWGGIVH